MTTVTPSDPTTAAAAEPAEAAPGAPSRTPSGPGARGRALRHLASEIGQGTVEYVGLLLLMATILAAVVGAASELGGNDKIGKQVVNQIGESIDKAGSGGR